jgi:uncharacterized protein (UPF0264 family)
VIKEHSMKDDAIHDGDQVFEDFIEKELEALAERARQKGICMDCLTDRLIAEMVTSLTRAGVPASNILGVVADGMALAEEPEPEEGSDHRRRVH